MSTNRLVRRFGQAGAVLAIAATTVLLSGGTAAAHVTAKVIGETAEQGGFTKITFRVPNEDNTAGTTKVDVKFPADTPVASLRTKPVAGWTATVTKTKLATPVMVEGAELTEAVDIVSWTANPGVRIGPGEFAEFEVSGGPLPTNTDKLIIPAVQTYDNGEVVRWDAPPPAAGAEEPKHPAPVVALTPKSGDGDHAAAAPAGTNNGAGSGAESQPVANTASASSTSTSDTTARWLGGIGLALGALGVGFGVGATLRARRTVAAAKGGE